MLKTNGEDYSWMGVMIHLADSALPVGAYAHSFGLEGMCQEGLVEDAETLREFFLRDVRHALVSVDLPLMVRSHAAALDGNGRMVRKWDEMSWAMRPTGQLRDAASKVGRQTWMLFEKTWGRAERVAERSWFRFHQAPVVTGVIFAEQGVPVEGCLWAGTYQVYSALVQAALKLLPIGPGAGQVLLTESLGAMEEQFAGVMAMEDHALGTFNPMWDIAASRHERAAARMFIS